MVWRMSEDRLWVRILKENYVVGAGRFLPRFTRGSIGCSVWRGLAKNCKVLKFITQFEVGDSNMTSFWKDNWTGKVPLFKVYYLSKMKNGSVAEFHSVDMHEDSY